MTEHQSTPPRRGVRTLVAAIILCVIGAAVVYSLQYLLRGGALTPPELYRQSAAVSAPEVAVSEVTQTNSAAPAISGKSLVTYPGVEIDLVKREVRVQAVVSDELHWGKPLIEFVLTRGRDKAYETLFITEADPGHIQLGLILLGLRPAPLPESLLQKPGKPEKLPPEMPPLVEISVHWTTAQKKQMKTELSELLEYRKDERKPHDLAFAFTGSQFVSNEGKSMLAASLSGDTVTLLYNPVALLNLSYFEASPYGEDMAGFEVNIERLPPDFRTTRKQEINNKGVVDLIVTRPLPVTLVLRPQP